MNSRLFPRLLTLLFALPQLLWVPFRRKPSEIKQILVLHQLLLGDTLMMVALLKKLRTVYPKADIVMVCPKAAATLFIERPYAVKSVGFSPRSMADTWMLISQYRAFDHVLIPGDNRWSWLALAMGAKWITAFEGGKAWKNVPVNELRPFPEKLTAWGDLQATLIDGASVKYDSSDWLLPEVELDLPTEPYAVLHLGASRIQKLWPSMYWQRVAGWLRVRGIKIIWSVGKGEDYLLKGLEISEIDQVFAGDLSLVELAYVIKNSTCLVCPDTGIAHLGRILSTPTVAIFGSGSPLISGAGEFWKDSPFFPIWDNSVACRDQSRLFGRNIPWVQHCLRGEDECSEPSCIFRVKPDLVCHTIEKACSNFILD